MSLLACGDDDDTPNGPGKGDGGGAGICTASGDCDEWVELGPPNHVQGRIDYQGGPPAGGSHNPCWGRYGVHDEALPAENWVHNLEHGAVVYLYHCPDGCDAEVATLTELVEERPRALLTPYTGLSTRFAIVAWGYRLESDDLDRAAFEAFYDAHVDHAPESIAGGPPSGCP
jgi:hypothetical protein